METINFPVGHVGIALISESMYYGKHEILAFHYETNSVNSKLMLVDLIGCA